MNFFLQTTVTSKINSLLYTVKQLYPTITYKDTLKMQECSISVDKAAVIIRFIGNYTKLHSLLILHFLIYHAVQNIFPVSIIFIILAFEHAINSAKFNITDS